MLNLFHVELLTGCGKHNDAVLIETEKTSLTAQDAAIPFGEQFYAAKDSIRVTQVSGAIPYALNSLRRVTV
jgi:hypothetical protein